MLHLFINFISTETMITELFTDSESVHNYMRYLILKIQYIKSGFKNIDERVSCEQSKLIKYYFFESVICVF